MSRAAADDGEPSRPIDVPERCVGYGVYDPLGQKIGRVEKIFVNGNHEPEYLRVRTGLFATKSVLIPVRFLAIDEERRTLMLKCKKGL